MSGTPNSIEKAYVNSFRAGFEQAFQQFDAKLVPFVKLERQASEFAYYDRVGEADAMTEVVDRAGDNPDSNIDHDRRRMQLRDYELGKYVDEKDLIRVATDPSNEYTSAMSASGFRKMDDIIFDAVYGNSFAGKAGATTHTWVSAPSSGKVKVGGVNPGSSNKVTTAGDFQLGTATEEGIVVAHDWAGFGGTPASSGLTLNKLKAIRATMMRLEAIDQDQNIPIFITYRQFNDLLGIDQVINSDYAVRKALAEGQTTSFMGFTFIHSERVPVDGSGRRRCLVLANNNKLGKFAMRIAVARSLDVNMWRDSSKKNIPYIYFKLSCEASRFWGEITAEVLCAE